VANQEDTEADALSSFTEIGAEIAGGLAPIAVGTLIAGPIGSAAGAFAAPFASRIFGKLAKEFSNRALGRREKTRVGATIIYTVAKINDNLESGQQVRQDDFFQELPEDRAPAVEIAEGVLLAAQREHQERKLPFYGNLLANIAFREDIDRSLANALVGQAEQMSYRQLCLLSGIVQRVAYDITDQVLFNYNEGDASYASILADLYMLSQQRIIDTDLHGEIVKSLLF
jgi:hypothetical protein